MSGHDEMREHELLRGLRHTVTYYLHQFPLDPVSSKVTEKVELSPSRGLRAPIGQVSDLTPPELMARAEKYRQMAMTATTTDVQNGLLRLADMFEKMAMTRPDHRRSLRPRST